MNKFTCDKFQLKDLSHVADHVISRQPTITQMGKFFPSCYPNFPSAKYFSFSETDQISLTHYKDSNYNILFFIDPFGTIIVYTKGKMKNIMLVEDDLDMNFILTDLLKRSGYRVDSYISGEEALENLEDNNYDAIIADYNLPGMDGIEMLEKIPSRYCKMRKIVISAYGNEIILSKTKQLHARYLDKPFRNYQLLNLIAQENY